MTNLIIQTWTKGITKARWGKIFIAIAGTYYHFNFTKYRRRYLAEAHYRISRRFDLASFVGRSFTPARAPHLAPSAGCGSRSSRSAERSSSSLSTTDRNNRHANLSSSPVYLLCQPQDRLLQCKKYAYTALRYSQRALQRRFTRESILSPHATAGSKRDLYESRLGFR